MKRHIKYIVYSIAPCKIGDLHRYILEFYNEKDANEFIYLFYCKFDFNNTCLKLMKVLC